MTNRSVAPDNLALARRFIDAYNVLGTWDGTGDLAKAMKAMTDTMTEDAVLEIPVLGVTQNRQWEKTASGALALVTTRHIDVKRMLVCENGVAVEMLWSAISRGGPGMPPEGERVEMENCIVLTMRDGRISRYCEYMGRVKGIDLEKLPERYIND